MTSRLYSELSSASNMSLIDEMDENTTPTVAVNNTPRAKMVPSKRTRVSESPLTSHQQNFLFKGDKNLEETFAEQPSVLASPLTVNSEQLMQSLDTTRQSGSAFGDKNLEETFVEQPSVLASPLTFNSQQPMPSLDTTRQSGSAFGDKNLEETFVEQPSVLASPLTFNSQQPMPSLDTTQQSGSAFGDKNLEETFFEQPSVLASSFSVNSEQPKPSLDTSQQSGSTSGDENLKETYNEMVSFLEEEMQVYAEEKCKCARFESIIKEYTILREKVDKVPHTTFKTSDKKTEDEMFRMQEELVNVMTEVENYKKAADIAKKEADDFQFVLDEEKRRAKNRIADLQKENFALSDKLESMKAGKGGGGDAIGIQQKVNELQDELAQLKNQFEKANNEIDEYKVKFQNAQKEADTLQAALNLEKGSMNARLAEMQSQKDSEVESLKAAIADSVPLKDELKKLRKKLQIFDTVVEQGYKVEEMCKQLKAKIVILEKEKNERTQLEEELAHLKDQFTNANNEIDGYKVKLETVQKEADTFQAALNLEKESMNAQLAELQFQKDSEIESLKAENAELEEKLQSFDTVVKQFFEVEKMCKQFKAEIAVLAKEKNEKNQLQEELSQLKYQFTKANNEIDEYKVKFETFQKEADTLQVALNLEKESMNARLAEVQSQKDSEIESLKAAVADGVTVKDELQELKQKLQEELGQLNDQLTKANVDKEKLNKKVDKLYNDLDAADNERKELSETIFELQSKLTKYGESGDEIRAVIDMGEVVNRAASSDTSFKSVTEEPQPTLSSSNSLKRDDEIDLALSNSKDTPKRKQSFGAKIASPFRRAKKEESQSNVSKKEENPNTTCTTQ